MANNREKRKLTSKQADIISITISVICFICLIVCEISLKLLEGDMAIAYVAAAFAIAGILYIMFGTIFKVHKRKDEEEEEKSEREIELEITQYLSYADFKKVYRLVKDDMVREILQNEGCEFYAKLTEDNKIHIIAKDKYGEEVFDDEIDDYFYFYFCFVLKK